MKKCSKCKKVYYGDEWEYCLSCRVRLADIGHETSSQAGSVIDLEENTLSSAMDRLSKQHVSGQISDEEFKKEVRKLLEM